MIFTSRVLVRELLNENDDFITVMLDGREYVIESIGRVYDDVDNPVTHRCLNIKDGGSGYIKR